MTGLWPVFAFIMLTVVGSTGSGAVFQDLKSESEVKVTLGKQEILIPAGYHQLNYFSDEAVSVLKEHPLTFLMVCEHDTYLFSGKDWTSAVPFGKVLSPGRAGSPDNGYAGIGAVYVDKRQKRITAFYHAEDQEGIGKVPQNNVQGFFGAVCVATSSLDGTKFTKLGPAITADKPKMARGWETEGGPPAAWLAQGVGEPHVCVDATGKNLLCYYTEWSNRLKRGVQICVARCSLSDKGLPGKWEKYYQDDFTEKGLGGHETPIISAGRKADTFTPHVVWIGAWKRYVILFGVAVHTEIQAQLMPPKDSGLYISTSEDGIRWRKPHRIVPLYPMVLNNCKCAIHPTLLISSANSKSARGQLLYGFTQKWPDVPHHLAGRPITITFDGE